MKYLDYIFYRVTKAYMKWDGEGGSTGICAISLVVSMLFVDLYGVIHLTFFFDTYGNSYKEEAKSVGIVLMLIVLLLCYIRYRKRYRILKERWKNETENQRFWRGILVILAIIMPIVFAILYTNVLRHLF
jgi:amino acid transporter